MSARAVCICPTCFLRRIRRHPCLPVRGGGGRWGGDRSPVSPKCTRIHTPQPQGTARGPFPTKETLHRTMPNDIVGTGLSSTLRAALWAVTLCTPLRRQPDGPAAGTWMRGALRRIHATDSVGAIIDRPAACTCLTCFLWRIHRQYVFVFCIPYCGALPPAGHFLAAGQESDQRSRLRGRR